MTNVPAGWYPDPAGSPQQRWWDGSHWSQTLQPTPTANPYAPMQPFAASQPYGSVQPYNPSGSYYGAQQSLAPEGTNPSTPQMWIIALWPILGLISVAVYASLGGLSSAALETTTSLTAADYANFGLSVIVWLAMVPIAYLDYRELQNRGVPRPLHWAFAFIPFPIVYVIARTVTVYSRTRRGLAPLFVWIGASALTYIASFVIGIAIGLSSLGAFT